MTATATTYRLELPGRPYTCNQARVWHFRRVAAETEYWRSLAKAEATNAHLPRAEKITVTAQSFLRGNRSRDTGADYLATKAAVDGLDDANVIPDDDGAHLLWIRLLPPVLGAARDCLVLDVEVVG